MKKIFILYLVIYSVVHFWSLDKFFTVNCDEVFYSQPSWNYWHYGYFKSDIFSPVYDIDKKNLLWGNIYFYFIALIYKVFGLSVKTTRFQALFSGIAVLIILYLLVRKLYNEKIALIAVLFMSLSLQFVECLHMCRPDMMLLAFILLSLYIFIEAAQREKLLYFLIAGLIAALGLDVHPPAYLGIAVLTAWGISHSGIKSSKFRFLLYGLLTGLLYYSATHIFNSFPLYFIQLKKCWSFWEPIPLLNYNLPTMIKLELDRFITFFWFSKYKINMLIFAFLLLAAIDLLRNYKDKYHQSNKLITLWFLTLIFCFVFFVSNKHSYLYVIHFYPLFAILIARFIGKHLKEKKTTGWIAVFLLIPVLLIKNIYVFYTYRDCSYDSYIAKLKKHIPDDQIVMGPSICWFGFARNKKFIPDYFVSAFPHRDRDSINKSGPTLAFLGNSFSDFLDKNQIGYIIVENNFLYQVGKNSVYEETEVKRTLSEKCNKIAEITDRYYGVGWFKFLPKEPFTTTIYKRKKTE